MMASKHMVILILIVITSLMIRSCTEIIATSPEWIAYNSSQDGALGIYVIRTDGVASPVMLTAHKSSENAPTWAPDGMSLAFTSNQDGNAEIYRINSDGTDPTRLTNNPAEDSMPAWSPDGSVIAFVSSRDNGNSDIYVMDLNGGSVTRLTNDSALKAWPAWSPNGQKIAFDSNRSGKWQIFVINADGTSLTQMTNEAENGWAAWSQDGSRIAFTSYRDGNAEIYLMDADGSNQTRLTESGGRDIFPTWSPDGQHIAFSSERSGNNGKRDIYIMNSDGTDIKQLTSDPSDESQPRWSPVKIAVVGSLETVVSDDPWFGTPQCQRDVDGDGYPDIPTITFPTTDNTAYIVFLFGNMRDGMSWAWSAPSLRRNFAAVGSWQAGPAGRYVHPVPLGSLTPGEFSVSFNLGGIQHTVKCSVVGP